MLRANGQVKWVDEICVNAREYINCSTFKSNNLPTIHTLSYYTCMNMISSLKNIIANRSVFSGDMADDALVFYHRHHIFMIRIVLGFFR